MERALPAIRERASVLAIGLAADCDSPEPAVEQLFTANLSDATALPFVAFLTPDGKWIEGRAGHCDQAELLTMLERAAKSPLLDASPAVRKQLEKPSAAATAAAAKGEWKPVLAAAREARKSTGRCPERSAIQDAAQKARAWAVEQLDAAVREAGSGGDLAPVRKRIASVAQAFAGEPEAEDAEVGRKAVMRLTSIRDAEAKGNAAKDLREKAAATFPGTRWTAIFRKPEAAGDGK